MNYINSEANYNIARKAYRRAIKEAELPHILATNDAVRDYYDVNMPKPCSRCKLPPLEPSSRSTSKHLVRQSPNYKFRKAWVNPGNTNKLF